MYFQMWAFSFLITVDSQTTGTDCVLLILLHLSGSLKHWLPSHSYYLYNFISSFVSFCLWGMERYRMAPCVSLWELPKCNSEFLSVYVFSHVNTSSLKKWMLQEYFCTVVCGLLTEEEQEDGRWKKCIGRDNWIPLRLN